MTNRFLTVLGLLASLFACGCSSSTTQSGSGDPSAPQDQNPPDQSGNGNQTTEKRVNLEWQGPPIRASIDGAAAKHEVRLEMTAPSGGFEWRVEKVNTAGDVVTVDLVILRPGSDELVTQALVEFVENVELPIEHGTLEVRAQEWTRGVNYFTEPARMRVTRLTF